jgi:hypothetical protein
MLKSRSGPDVGVGVFDARRRFPDDTSSSEDDCPPRRVTPLNETLVSSDSLSAKKGREAALISEGALTQPRRLSAVKSLFMKKVLAFPKVDEEPYQSTEPSREPHRDPC